MLAVLREYIKITAIIAKSGPSIIKTGRISLSGGIFCERSNMFWVAPKKYSSKALALIEAMNMGAMARREKCLKIASCAKITPARGALKPAEIAAATPHPIKISGLIRKLKYFFINRPIVDPK